MDYTSREWIHIPPNGKFGKSSTQNAHFLGDMLVMREGSWWFLMMHGGVSGKKKGLPMITMGIP